MGVNDRCAVGQCNNARKYPEKFVIKPHILAFDTSLQLRFWKCTDPKLYSNAYLSTPMHTLWAKIGWVSIFFNKLIPNWRKWPQFESCQMHIFKIYSSSTIHQTTACNSKCIFVHSHTHPLSKNWLSQHIFKKQILNWRKWPQFESCQMYIFKIYSSSTILPAISFTSNAYLSTPMHTLWAKIGCVSIFLKKQIPIWRKWPQFESCQMYIFKIYSSSTILPAISFTSNAYLSTPMHTLWAKIDWVSIFLKNRFQIDANDLNLRVAKCIFSKSTPHQQYTRQ